MGIDLKDIEKVYLLFKWINPTATEAIQLWEKGKTPIVNNYYKIQSGRSIVSVFFIIEKVIQDHKAWGLNSLFLIMAIF